jgi:hypothetical protein
MSEWHCGICGEPADADDMGEHMADRHPVSKDKLQVKVIEIEANKLVPGAKYIFTVDPRYAGRIPDMVESLTQLIGSDFLLFPLPEDALKVFSIEDKENQ